MNKQEFNLAVNKNKQEMGGVSPSTQISGNKIKQRLTREQEPSQVHRDFYLRLDGALPVCIQIGYYPS